MSRNCKPPPGPSVGVGAHEDLAAFDRLPPDLRETLRSTRFEFAAPSVLEALSEGWGQRELICMIMQADEEALERATTADI